VQNILTSPRSEEFLDCSLVVFTAAQVSGLLYDAKRSPKFFNLFSDRLMKINVRFYFTLLLVFLLNACANQALQRSESDSENTKDNGQTQNTLAYTDKSASSTLSPALSSLLNTAEKQVLMEDFNGAAASLERALRISPNEALVHLRLAEVRLKQGQAHAALQLAFKGQSLLENSSASRNRNTLQKQFWKVIGDCYSYLGNYQKAEQAYRNL